MTFLQMKSSSHQFGEGVRGVLLVVEAYSSTTCPSPDGPLCPMTATCPSRANRHEVSGAAGEGRRWRSVLRD